VSWAKVDDGWWCHPKVMALPLAARGLWVSALSWSCAQRRSVVPPSFLAMVGGSDEDAEALIDAGLWIETANGWEIHDWSEYQEQSLSEKRAEAGRKGGLSRGKASKPEAKPKQADSNDEATGQAGTHPVPSLPIQPPPTPRAEQDREQEIRRTVALVAKLEAGDRADDGAWVGGIRREILTGPDTTRIDLIRSMLDQHGTPEAVAAAWMLQAPKVDPLLGGFVGRTAIEPPRPPLAEFHGFDHGDAAPADVARSVIAAARGRTEP